MRILIGLLLSVCCHTAFSCICQKGTLPDAFEEAALVFRARVTSVELSPDSGEVRIAVDQVWKSDGQPITAIAIGDNCSFPFEAGKRYIIFARRFSTDPGRKVSRLGVSICSNTTDLSHPETVEEVLALEEFLRDRKPKAGTR
jgi:hypothetical protein